MTDAEKRIRNVLGSSWNAKLGDMLATPSMREVAKKVNARRKTPDINVYPSREDTFRALRLTSFEDTKVVIIGAEPFCEPDVADGLAFSSQDPFAMPPSLTAILAEVRDDIYDNDDSLIFEKNLSRWTEQGVLLLNSVLSVEEGVPFSHEKLGWQEFTTQVISLLISRKEPCVFMLWGMGAKAIFDEAKENAVDSNNHLVLTAAHPEAESHRDDGKGGFFECKHFSQANTFLKENWLTEINW